MLKNKYKRVPLIKMINQLRKKIPQSRKKIKRWLKNTTTSRIPIRSLISQILSTNKVNRKKKTQLNLKILRKDRKLIKNNNKINDNKINRLFIYDK